MNPSASPSRRQEVKVLVADDAFDSRQWLTRLLRQFMRVHLIEARDGLEAIEAFRLLSPDIMFLDIDMPEKDGLAVLKDIRDVGSPAFVVIVSAHGGAAKVSEAVSLGVNGFVVKPYSARRILEILELYAAQVGQPGLLLPV